MKKRKTNNSKLLEQFQQFVFVDRCLFFCLFFVIVLSVLLWFTGSDLVSSNSSFKIGRFPETIFNVIMESGIHLEYNKGICDLLNRNCNETLTNVLVIIVIISFIHCSTICQNLRNILIILYGVSIFQMSDLGRM